MTRIHQNVPSGNDVFIAGDTARFDVSVTQADHRTPMNLTGATVRFALADDPGKTPHISLTSVDDPGQVGFTDAENGELEIELRPSDTIDLSGEFYYEIEVEDPGGRVATVTTGSVRITPDTA